MYAYVLFFLLIELFDTYTLLKYNPTNFYLLINTNTQFHHICYLTWMHLEQILSCSSFRSFDSAPFSLGLGTSSAHEMAFHCKWFYHLSWRGGTLFPGCRGLDHRTSLVVFYTWESWHREAFSSSAWEVRERAAQHFPLMK